MALSFGSHTDGHGGEKWILSPFSRTLWIFTSRGVCWSKPMNDEAIAKFGQSLRGALIGRNHPEYGEARKLYLPRPDRS
jgi:hypothetical protein